jgi:hypothetical protein
MDDDQGNAQTREEPGTLTEENPEGSPEIEARSLYRHPLAAIGGALLAAGVLAFVALVIIDLAAPENPYRSLVTWVAVPFVITVGAILFLIALRLQVVRARKRGEKVHFHLRVEPSDPRYMRNLWLFLGATLVLLLLVGWSGFRAYEATDSVAFCGETCHEVMSPQGVTYENSAHARVPCVDCHIGPGGSFWVRSKIDGIRQVWKTMTDSFERPIETPIANLRPAQETCEQCHWPDQFYGEKLVDHTYYANDEDNSPWSISLLVNVGGGNPRTGKLEGIHWHMITNNTIEYAALDHQRQEIPWVRVTDAAGNVTVYSDPLAGISDPEAAGLEVRTFDCMDCHNRPSHSFEPPAVSLNLALSTGALAGDLPFVRKVSLDLLNAQYETRDEAHAAIESGLAGYYAESYPEVAASRGADLERATAAVLDIYDHNFFPEMKTDYRVRVNNLSHFTNDGCFRCHSTPLENEQGEQLASSCDSCHSIVAQGPSADVNTIDNDLGGLEFIHPFEIGRAWQTIKCTQCHTPTSGY